MVLPQVRRLCARTLYYWRLRLVVEGRPAFAPLSVPCWRYPSVPSTRRAHLRCLSRCHAILQPRAIAIHRCNNVIIQSGGRLERASVRWRCLRLYDLIVFARSAVSAMLPFFLVAPTISKFPESRTVGSGRGREIDTVSGGTGFVLYQSLLSQGTRYRECREPQSQEASS